MKLTYETGIATLIQFITLGLLNIVGALNSTISTCSKDGSNCLTEIFVSSILFLILMGWFGFVCLLGYMAQERRSKRLARALIGAEGLVALVSLISAKYPSNLLGQITSIIGLISALWIIVLAYRLMRSGGKRITSRQRPRHRRSTSG